MDQDELALRLAKVSETLSADRDESVMVARICELAVELVEVCDHASLTLRTRRGRLRTVAASSPLGEEFDALQYELDEGPAVLTATAAEPCRSNDVGRDARWPVWGPKAAERGARSVVSVGLTVNGGRPMGAVTLYSHRLGVWDEQEYDRAYLFALHAALALDAAQVVTGLRAALDSRHQIGLAQGILMERHGISTTQSFEVLQRFSNTSNVKLTEVAARIVRETEGG